MEFREYNKLNTFPHVYGAQDDTWQGVTFGAKVKIQGVHAAVRVSTDGFAVAQDGEQDMTLANDPHGFAAWVAATHDTWPFMPSDTTTGDVVYYGSWAGDNINVNGSAASKLNDKFFFVFAVYMEESDTMIVDPELIERTIPDLDQIVVLPWDRVWNSQIDFSHAEDCGNFATMLNEAVVGVLEQDPIIFGVFGVDGTGGGWVVSPVCNPGMDPTTMKTVDRYWYDRLTFKVEGASNG